MPRPVKYKTEEERLEAKKASIKKYNQSSKGKVCRKKYYKAGKQQSYQENKWGSGIYGIFSSGECLYIGQSKSLYRRIQQHNTWLRNPKIAPNPSLYERILKSNSPIFIGMIEAVNTDNLIPKEKEYISKYNPSLNTDFNL